jgi:outer membrane protein TolC
MLGGNCAVLAAKADNSIIQRLRTVANVLCNQRNGLGAAWACGLAAWLACGLSGCTQMYYRMQADKEVKYLVTQKSNDARWQYDSFTIGMDPRSRYFDPTDPDGPPMPYDDPASHLYMHCIAGKKAYPCWHSNGDWYGLENPRWKDLLMQYNEMADDGAIKLTMNGSVCLGQVHSTEYRTQIETIYLSALDVSTERFRFDVQFFGNSNTVFTHLGAERTGIGERNTLLQGNIPNDTTYSMTKHFSTGADLLVGFANSFVWQFAGPDTNVSSSLLNFSLVQPLLRRGGRVVALEQLTIVERNLLANLRTFQRYRQGFYTTLTVGNGTAGPVGTVTRRGGFFGGTGLTGFTGQGAGGIGGVASGQFGINAGQLGGGGTGGAGIGFVAGGAGLTGGYLGLLQQLQQVYNAESLLSALLRTLGLLEANLEAGLIDIVQVDQFRQQIESARAGVLSAQVAYQTALDSYKAGLLGLPPDIAVKPDEGLLEQFQFLDTRTVGVQRMIDDFVTTVGRLPQDPNPADIKRALDLLVALREKLASQFASGHADMEALDAKTAERKQSMDARRIAQFDADRVRMTESLADVETRFNNTEGDLQNLLNSVGTEEASKVTDRIVAVATGLSGLTQELALIKARARLDAVTIPYVNLASERALEIARANRYDWMNNRASLVDTWRLIAFNANALKAGLDLTFSGDLGTVGNNPAAFNGQNGSLRVGMRFDAPFTRRLERNAYRNALITYQQTRRSLYQYQDGVNFTLRSLIRQLEQLQINMEIQRRAVVIAIRRVDKTREDLNKPPAPAKPTTPGQAAEQVESLGPTVAVNLITALNDLQAAQNTFMSVVLNHYETRMLLYRELGIMELDDCGMWIDKPINEADWLTEEECPMPPSLPTEWLEDAGVDLRAMHEGPSDELSDPADREAEVMAERTAGKSPRAPVALRKRLAVALGQSDQAEAAPLANSRHADAVELTSSKVPRWASRKGDVARDKPSDDLPVAEGHRPTASRLMESPPRFEPKDEPATGLKLRR